MQTCLNIDDVKALSLQGSVLTIGNFDGLHKGHQALINKTKFLAQKYWLKSALLTFKPHPRQVLQSIRPLMGRPTCHGPSDGVLMPLADVRFLQTQLQGDIDILWVATFTLAVARLSPLEFAHQFLRPLNVRHIVVGEGFRFAHRRQGDTKVLQQLGKQMGFQVHIVKPIWLRGAMVSSTRVRKALQRGDTQLAAQLLGRPYSVSGVVQRGQQKARELGFPTLNLKPPHPLALRQGVYVGYVNLVMPYWAGAPRPSMARDTRPETTKLKCVINYGNKPTFAGHKDKLIEAHVLTGSMLSRGNTHRRPRGYPAPHNGSGRAHLIRPSMGVASAQHRPREYMANRQLGDWYDQHISCYFMYFLRDEKKFDSPAALRKQIQRDIQKAKCRFECW